MRKNGAVYRLIAAMVIFGTVGVFARAIPLPTPVTAMLRGAIGAAVLLAFCLLRGRKPDGAAIRSNLLLLVLSGAAMGFNWILLVEAYRYTTVATATLCYYLAPTFVTLLAPLVLREKWTLTGIACALVALGGIALVSGATPDSVGDGRGILLGVGAAALYATVVLMNRRLGEIDAYSSTVVQLASAAAAMVPYLLLTQRAPLPHLTANACAMLAVICVVHTGLAYLLYLGSLGKVSTMQAALFAYLDPVVAVFASALWLGEPITWKTAVGAVLILGAAAAGELLSAKERKKQHDLSR
ncbi:MAG: DMT family transporter [Oscillospiraceae bacterium]|nr:DMT family transporter [Oscillospiraceae bacterium]